MEENRKEAFPEEPVSTCTASDAPSPYAAEHFPSAVGYRRSPGGDQQLPSAQGYPKTGPYPTQQYPPPQQQYGYPQGVQPLGYCAPIAMQPTQAEPVLVNLQLSFSA